MTNYTQATNTHEWRALRPEQSQELQKWAEQGYAIAKLLVAKSFAENAFEVIETDLWQGSNFSATGSWGVPRNLELETLQAILDQTNTDLLPNSRATILTQCAVHKSHLEKGVVGNHEKVIDYFDQAARIFEEECNDTRGTWTLRQKALYLERRFGEGERKCIVDAIRAAEESIQRADRGHGVLDSVRSNDAKWHQYGSRATLANLKRLEIGLENGLTPGILIDRLTPIDQLFQEANRRLSTESKFWGCGKPGYDHRLVQLELATLYSHVGQSAQAQYYYMAVEAESQRSLLLAPEHYKGSPRPYNLGLDNLTLAEAVAALGRKEEALGYVAIAVRHFGERHPELREKAEHLRDSLLPA